METPSPRPAWLHKSATERRIAPNMTDYAATRAAFRWDKIRQELQAGSGALDIASLALDRNIALGRGSRTAFRFLDPKGGRREVTFAELALLANRFAHGLAALGVGKGDRVFVLCGRIPDLYVSVLGSLRLGAVVSPLFSAFGPEPLATRIGLGSGRVLVTTAELYRRKVEKIRAQLPTLEHVLLAGVPAGEVLPPGTRDLAALLADAPDIAIDSAISEEDPALLHFTSGTTGKPKGAVHVHAAAVTHYATGRYALDLHPDDLFWCTADPGWVTGTSYGIIAPLLHGVTSVVDEAEFDAERWYRILEEERVSVWYTAPTAIRMLMKAGPELARKRAYPALRFVASVGEPLNPEAVWWGHDVLGLAIHDNWWQTETGGIMVSNYAALDIKPGSMGLPLPGVEACLVRREGSNPPRVIEEREAQGELAIRAGWPSMFRGYLGEEERYRKCFGDGLYLSGDLARRDADGYYWFVGRTDDVIKTAGHLVGPFEVESALMEHKAVAEAGVIGKPDPVVGEVIKAFVSLKQGFEPSEDLRMELLGHARKRLGAAVAPKEIEFRADLPRTRSGKIMRRLLKARELGLPEGDLSTLESGA